jgi:hypothetical protein
VRLLAELDIEQPLGVERIEVRHQQARTGVRHCAAVVVLLEAHAEPQEIGPPRLAPGVDLQPEHVRLPNEPVVEELVAVEAVLPLELVLELRHVERRAGEVAEHRLDARRIV